LDVGPHLLVRLADVDELVVARVEVGASELGADRVPRLEVVVLQPLGRAEVGTDQPVDAALDDLPHRVVAERRLPDRRVRLRVRLWQDLALGEAPEAAVEGEALFGPGTADDLESLLGAPVRLGPR